VSSSIDPASSLIDMSTLAAHLASPRRPHLAEARAVVAGATTGEEAWHRLFERGLIPGELFRSSERSFAVANTERSTAAAVHQLELRTSPATVDAAVTIASDVAGVLEAERLARILRTRLVRWGAEEVGRIEWVVLTHQVPFSFQPGPALTCALYSLEYALEERDLELRSLRADLPGVPPFVNDVIRANEGWPKAVAGSLEVPGAYGAPDEIVGVRFETLENPFEIALRIWALGYIVDHACHVERSTARFHTYMVDAPQNLMHRLREARERGA
jgi:hypothetical protein